MNAILLSLLSISLLLLFANMTLHEILKELRRLNASHGLDLGRKSNSSIVERFRKAT
jgi:hypothetical protein